MVKIAPETAIKLTCNDIVKHMICPDVDEITPVQRMLSGAISGALAQVCAFAGRGCLHLEPEEL